MAASLRTDEEIAAIYHRHVDTVYRICFSYMKNAADTEDIVQETFLKLITYGRQFQSENHEKAWLIVTASNACKDALKHWSRKTENIENCRIPADFDFSEDFSKDNEIVDAILRLPVKYKDAVYLYYYEGYTTAEIAKMLHCPNSTVRNRLAKARKLLKKYFSGGDDYHEKRNLQRI